MSNEKDVVLKISVSGTEISLEANPNQPLQSLVEKALKDAGQASTPDQWAFYINKDNTMVAVDMAMKAGDAAAQFAILYLNKKAGVTG